MQDQFNTKKRLLSSHSRLLGTVFTGSFALALLAMSPAHAGEKLKFDTMRATAFVMPASAVEPKEETAEKTPEILEEALQADAPPSPEEIAPEDITASISEDKATALTTVVAPAPAVEAPQTPYGIKFHAALDKVSSLENADYRILSAFYEARGNQPVFVVDGKLTDQGAAVIERIKQAETDGLKSTDYLLPEIAVGEIADPVAAAVQEMQLAKTALIYARHLARGRVNPQSLSKNIGLRPEAFDGLEAMKQLVSASSIDAGFDSLAPQNPHYTRLKAVLNDLQEKAKSAPEVVQIPDGRILRPNTRDARAPLLRQRFGLTLAEGQAETLYDETLVAAVEAFQEENGLKVDGIIGPNTLLYINKSVQSEIELVTLNMERWRWMPLELGQFHVKVNIPEFKARIFKSDVEVYETRVIVGKPKHETPIFSDEIEHIVVNPYWHVPYSIASKELLPKIKADPSYLTRNGYEVIYNKNGRAQQISTDAVNWDLVTPQNLPVRIRQTPGRGNALGDVKFMFPNRHSVYLHDTPSRNLFSRTSRALSHGCIRVHNPFDFATALLQEEPNLDGDKLQSMRGPKERTVHLQTHVPVHLMYFTAMVEQDGELRVFNDIYGHDRTLINALQQDRTKPLAIAGDF